MNMNKTIVTLALAASALTLASSASAAPFSGFYVGASVGHSSGDANQTRFSAPGGPFIFTQNDAEIDGWGAGVFAGYNHKMGNWLVGLEGNYDWKDVSGNDNGLGGDINELEQNWEASIRAKLGYQVYDDLVLYATGGYSWSDFDSNVLNLPTESVSNTFDGWTAGAGAELQVATNVTARLEYRYTDYSDDRVPLPINGYDLEVGPEIHNVSVGLSYHF
jgi:outer membrane immunogenic protein